MSVQQDFYRARAADALAEADRAVLDNVRDRCLRAASAWSDMADRAERTGQARERTEAAKKAALEQGTTPT